MNLEAVERILAQRWFFVAFNLAIGAAWVIWGVDVANICISILTLEALLIGQGRSRRHDIATQAKLDELVISQEQARDDIAHVEDLEEVQIAEKRI